MCPMSVTASSNTIWHTDPYLCDRVTVVRGLTVLRGLRAINQESLVALSIEILTASAPFVDKWS